MKLKSLRLQVDVPWVNMTTATPLADLTRACLMVRGFGCIADEHAIAVCTVQTRNWFTANANCADLYGRRVTGGGITNGHELNQLLTGDCLPPFFAFDKQTDYYKRAVAAGEVVIFCCVSGLPLPTLENVNSGDYPMIQLLVGFPQ